MYSRIVVSFPSATATDGLRLVVASLKHHLPTVMLYYHVVKFKIVLHTVTHFHRGFDGTWSVSFINYYF